MKRTSASLIAISLLFSGISPSHALTLAEYQATVDSHIEQIRQHQALIRDLNEQISASRSRRSAIYNIGVPLTLLAASVAISTGLRSMNVMVGGDTLLAASAVNSVTAITVGVGTIYYARIESSKIEEFQQLLRKAEDDLQAQILALNAISRR